MYSFKSFNKEIKSLNKGDISYLSNEALQIVFNRNNEKQIVLISGLHGDEKSGPIAILEFLKTFDVGDIGLTIFPLVNNLGWDKNKRKWKGLNLNRCFGIDTAPKFMRQISKRIKEVHPFLIDLHEDVGTGNSYIFKHSNDKFSIIDEISHELHCQIEYWDTGTKWIGTSEQFSLFVGSKFTTTFEASVEEYSMEERVQWQFKGIKLCFKYLQDFSSRFSDSKLILDKF